MTTLKTANAIRKYHRLLGFFLAGIMMIYATSGVLLIFRNTDVLKYEHTTERQLPANLSGLELSSQLKIKGLDVQEENEASVQFNYGHYDKSSGVATVTQKSYPALVQKLVGLHKASTNSPLFFMNIFFGCALLFFSVSAFFMYVHKLPAYKTGLKFAAAGVVVALIMVIAS